jgi:hypothetical protein
MKVKVWIGDGVIKCMSQMCSVQGEQCPRFYQCEEMEIEIKKKDEKETLKAFPYIQRDLLELLAHKQKEYIDLLGEELHETVGIASVHGWRSNRVAEGRSKREAIEALQKELQRG